MLEHGTPDRIGSFEILPQIGPQPAILRVRDRVRNGGWGSEISDGGRGRIRLMLGNAGNMEGRLVCSREGFTSDRSALVQSPVHASEQTAWGGLARTTTSLIQKSQALSRTLELPDGNFSVGEFVLTAYHVCGTRMVGPPLVCSEPQEGPELSGTQERARHWRFVPRRKRDYP